jgi:TolB-like protein
MEPARHQEVYHWLGRSYAAKEELQNATNTLMKLVAIDPPKYTLNPEEETQKFMNSYYAALKQVKGDRQIGPVDPGIRTMAILDFSNRLIGDDRANYDPLQLGLADDLFLQLDGSIKLKLVERERISWILDEIDLENDPGRFDTETAVRVGKQLGVHLVVFGSFVGFKDNMKLTARMVKVETSEIIGTAEAAGEIDNFFELNDELARKILERIEIEVPDSAMKAGTRTRSIEAELAYSAGVDLAAKGLYLPALEKFMLALKHDPDFERARKRAEAIKPLVG